MHPIIVWLRRDLRVGDNTALVRAAATGAPVVPLFIVDADIVRKIPSDGAAFDFQGECLKDLSGSLESLGGRLIIRQGHVLDVHRRLLQEAHPAALYFHRDYEPAGLDRDAAVMKLYEQHDVEVETFKDIVLQEPTEVLSAKGDPFAVFTPYARVWKTLPPPSPPGMPVRFTTPPLTSEPIPDAATLKKRKLIPSPAFRGGETEALRTWQVFLDHRLETYAEKRDLPAAGGTSRLSPYLRFGCIAISRIIEDSRNRAAALPPPARAGSEKFIDELIWREFYQAVLFHHPRLLTSNYRQEFDRLPWHYDDRLFAAWKEGRTGFPLVDAGMRELSQTGWMHNRVRMVVASFLTKDLQHDWRLGEKYFEEKLMDIETASNNGGWQWSASTGVDPRPLRIFNPTLQAKRFDPEATYIRLWVPELDRVPARFIHAPWRMPPAEQQKSGCIIGRDYPEPIVDHATAAEGYKKTFGAVKLAAKVVSDR